MMANEFADELRDGSAACQRREPSEMLHTRWSQGTAVNQMNAARQRPDPRGAHTPKCEMTTTMRMGASDDAGAVCAAAKGLAGGVTINVGPPAGGVRGQ